MKTRCDPPQPVTSQWLAHRSKGSLQVGDVVFHAPSQVFQAPGGGENQLVQTGRALESLDYRVRLFSPWTDNLKDARLLHLFGMSREGLELARVARSRSIPVVLSPISWHEPRAVLATAPSKVAAIRDLLKWGIKLSYPTAPSWRRELLGLADSVLPNSQAEAEQLTRLFGLDPKRISVVPNGVDPRFAETSPALFMEETGMTGDFVLYVGRIEPRKNVSTLVEAAKLAKLPLVIIGGVPPGHEAYFRKCLDSATPQMRFLPAIEHENPLLGSAYAAARVFALPSWFETPGLAALEAALAGCSMVVTPYGSTKEYFGQRALYPRPGRVEEIASALSQAWRKGRDNSLIARIQALYLWSDVARRTAEVYENLSN